MVEMAKRGSGSYGKLFVDDRREKPQTGYDVQCKDVTTAKLMLSVMKFDGISLDYDLGEGGTGLEILEFMKEKGIIFPRINIHSDHVIGREEMSAYCAKWFPDTEVTFRPA